MNCSRIREELVSHYRLPEGARGVMAGGPSRDRSFALFDLQRKRREEAELETKYKEGKQMLECLQRRRVELYNKAKKERELHLSFNCFLKEENVYEVAKKAERERKEVFQLEDVVERLKLENAKLMERKQKLQRGMEKQSLFLGFMVRVVKMTQFDDVQAFTGHLESLLHFRSHLCQRKNKAQQQVNQQRKALRALEEKYLYLRLHVNNQLSQLQTELEETRSQALTWEKKWTHIQETAARKTLQLGQIKMATLNIYEMTDDKAGEEAVGMNDTEKQLEKIKTSFRDHWDIMKQHQTTLLGHGGQRKDETKPKKSITTHCKKQASI